MTSAQDLYLEHTLATSEDEMFTARFGGSPHQARCRGPLQFGLAVLSVLSLSLAVAAPGGTIETITPKLAVAAPAENSQSEQDLAPDTVVLASLFAGRSRGAVAPVASRSGQRTPITTDIAVSMLNTGTEQDFVVEKLVTETELPFEVIKQDDPNLTKGTEKIIQAGENGKTVNFEEVVLLDGEEVSRYIIAEPLTYSAVDQIVAIGTKAPQQASTATNSNLGKAPSGTVWEQLAKCESSGNPAAVSRNGLYYGLYQFSLGTWKSVGGTGLPSQATAEEQTRLAEKLQARSGWGQWPACSRKLGLR